MCDIDDDDVSTYINYLYRFLVAALIIKLLNEGNRL